MRARQLCFFAAFFTALSFWPLPWAYSAPLDRCGKYWSQVIRESRYHVGMDAPAPDFMGQIEVESACNADATAFDGGRGLGQFMPRTADWLQDQEASLREISPDAAPYDPKWAIRGLILYDRRLYRAAACREWHYAFRAYNGGLAAVNREISRAGSCVPSEVAAACDRRIIRLKSGLLDLCRVNIAYPEKIAAAGRKYRERL